MEKKEVNKEEVKVENNNQEQKRYSNDQQLVANNADRMFNLLNSMITSTCDAMLDIGTINKSLVDEIKLENPMARLIEMFEGYLDDGKKKHAGYLANNHLKLSKDDKAQLKEIDKNKPAVVVPAKQVNELKLG